MSSIASYMQANATHEPDLRFENVPDNAILNEQFIANQQQQQQSSSGAKKFRLQISQRLNYTAKLAFASFIILLISFASPYWLSSYKFTDSAFRRLGLWEFCFHNYRHPSYQYDTKFTGCHWIYSPVYTNIRDWLQPSWFMFVQAVATIGLCASALGLAAISIIFMHFLIQYQLIILCIALVCHMFTTMLLGFALLTFYLKAFERSWIMYPNFNHLDWSFLFAFISMCGNGTASYFYYQEIQLLKKRLLKMKRLIVATSNGRSLNGGDADSIDQVYASRSVGSYGPPSANDGGQSRSMQGSKDPAAMIYPHFTQV